MKEFPRIETFNFFGFGMILATFAITRIHRRPGPAGGLTGPGPQVEKSLKLFNKSVPEFKLDF